MTLDEFLTDAARRSAGSEMTLSIRELLGHWGAKRRDPDTVRTITSDLRSHGLRTEPSFEISWIDTDVTLTKASVPKAEADDEWVPSHSPLDSDDVSLTMSSLQSATAGVTSVRPSDSLVRARSLMLRHDYSQLPVMRSERSLLGVISWESIAKGRLDGVDTDVSGVLAPAVTVSHTADLLSSIPRIIESGYVFVEDRTKRITGIVTTSDLSLQFELLAGPFLLIGEAERRLRRLADRTFDPDLMRAVVHDSPERARKVNSAAGLTIGEMMRLFEPDKNWTELGTVADRKTFLEALEEMRKLRNAIMHFNPDPHESSALTATRNFVKWLEHLDATDPRNC
ncbi:CBS domain-containing protein [Rhodococcoides corynebacterioides]|uniref:CBS domain-containing protein n=1 Tax=Rhodococcoides corynebacterioides TaxID=53972 RepID=UPI001C9A69C7|nr:CBS domain-containing protein [Rhodococcus corynebacterioides]MBY6363261.1 CBS domain-containing protein [Rhodococcus corynebacterioides]